MSYTIRGANKGDLQHLPNIERSAGNLFRTLAPSSTSAADSNLQDFSPEERKSIATLADDEPTTADDHKSTIREWKTSLQNEFGLDRNRHGDLLPENINCGGVWVAVRTGKSITESQRGNPIELVEEPVGFISATILRLETIEDRELTSNDPIFAVHINEVSIHAAHQRYGLATRLIHTVCDTAKKLNDTLRARVGEPRNDLKAVPGDELSQVSNGSDNEYIAPPEPAELRRYTTQSSLNITSSKRSAAAIPKIAFLTLTTFSSVPFNAPFYRRRFGFNNVSASLIKARFGDQAQRIWDEEQDKFSAIGLAQRRCWMYLDV